jgi:hypothetical protein
MVRWCVAVTLPFYPRNDIESPVARLHIAHVEVGGDHVGEDVAARLVLLRLVAAPGGPVDLIFMDNIWISRSYALPRATARPQRA